MHGSYNRTVESLLIKYPSRPFNPNIANVFYLAGFIESWGRGIEKYVMPVNRIICQYRNLL